MLTRREFLQRTGAVSTALLFTTRWDTLSVVAAQKSSPNVTKFLDPLPIPPVLTPDTLTYTGAEYYPITINAGRHQFHQQLPVTALDPYTTWGYGGADYLGPTIEAHRGTQVVADFDNGSLPLIPVIRNATDTTLYHGMSYPAVRTTAHLHGGFTAPQYDGHPDSWSDPAGTEVGEQFTDDPYIYSNQQPAATLWYHDHAMGTTRLNVYAGLAGFYLLRDDMDTGKRGTGLSLPVDRYEIPIAIQDRVLNPDGTLFYPTTSGLGSPYPHPVWVPEFFGDVPVVNGKAFPYLEVEPRRYRLRFLNGSQARFYNLWLEDQKSNHQYSFWLIGMEQGFLPQPVQLSRLLIAPGERADVIVDFSQVPAGRSLTLMNNAKAPYPGGQGGTVSQIMQFRVVNSLASSDATTRPADLVLPSVPRLTPTAGVPQREIVMKETEDPLTGTPTDVRLNGKWFAETPIDENPIAGTTEIWQFINLTVDAHPMHLHLVRFQVVNRQPFDVKAYGAAWTAWQRGAGPKPVLDRYLIGPAVSPPPEELGFKDTAKAYPGQVLRIIATFDVPPGTTLPADYVYHCHILEHEENEMMRPFQVVGD